LAGLIGDRGIDELASPSEHPLQLLSFGFQKETLPLNANLKASRKERFKLAVMTHAFDSALCNNEVVASSEKVFSRTMAIAKVALSKISQRSAPSLQLENSFETKRWDGVSNLASMWGGGAASRTPWTGSWSNIFHSSYTYRPYSSAGQTRYYGRMSTPAKAGNTAPPPTKDDTLVPDSGI